MLNLISQADKLREQGKYEEAQKFLKKLLRDDKSGSAELLSLLTHVLIQKNDLRIAKKVLARARSINPSLNTLVLNEARILLKESKPAEALKLAQEFGNATKNFPELDLLISGCLSATGKHAEALELINRILSNDPSFAEAYINRAIYSLKKDKCDAAIRDFQAALKLKRHLAPCWTLLATTFAKTGNLNEAIKAQNAAHEIDPSNIVYLSDLGEFLRRAGRTQEAISKLGTVAEIAPSNIAALTNLGAALQQANRIDEAKSIYEKVLKIDPKANEALSNLGNIYLTQHQFESAYSYFKLALSICIDSSKLNLKCGFAAEKLKLFDDAEHFYKNSVELEPKCAEARTSLAKLLFKLGRHDEAEPAFRYAISIDPNSSRTQLNYAYFLSGLQRFSEAIDYYRRAIVLDHSNSFAHANLANALAEVGNITEAENHYRIALEDLPSSKELHFNFADLLLNKGDPNQAIIFYNKALNCDSNFAEASAGLARAYEASGQREDAISAYRNAISINPHFVAALNSLGNLLQKELDSHKEAELCYRRAIKNKPDSVDARSNLAGLLSKFGLYEEAESLYREALYIEPKCEKLRINFGALLREVGKFDEAESLYHESLKLIPDSFNLKHSFAEFLRETGRISEAKGIFDELVANGPCKAKSLNSLATLHKQVGDFKQATELFKKALLIAPEFVDAHFNIAQTRRFSAIDAQLDSMLELYRSAKLSTKDKALLCFALGKVFEDVGDIESSFHFYIEGNELRRMQLKYDKEEDQAYFNRLKSASEKIDDSEYHPRERASLASPIFIVGMPRSGTTLVDQVVTAHSMVSGAGEVKYLWQLGARLAEGLDEPSSSTFSSVRMDYLSRLNNHATGTAFITDKTPHNFLYVGLIHKIFPDAKLIHVTRDPKAVCWGNFKQHFSGNGLQYAYSLEDVVSHYLLYHDLMEFWRSKYQSFLYTVDYEALTENQEAETKNLITWLGLPWDDACLHPQKNTRAVTTASIAQVRKEVFKGSSRAWKKYDHFLDGAFDRLDALRSSSTS